MKKFHPQIQVSEENILHNFHTIQKAVSPAKVMAVIKADAYSHNLLKVAQLLQNKADYFFVERLRDAVFLRKQKISTPILLAHTLPKDIPICCQYNIEFSLFDKQQLQFLENYPKKVQVHLKIDTGMGRLGFSLTELQTIYQKIQLLKNIELKGIYSHFAEAENSSNPLNQKQIENFQKAVKIAKEKFQFRCQFHLANSAGIVNFPQAYYDLVRVGLLLYGVYHQGYKHSFCLKPALKLAGNIFSIKPINKGEGVGYSHSWKAKKKGNLALVDLGYEEGLKRSLSNKAEALVDGKRYPIVGNISMGTSALFLEKDHYPIGTEAVFIGTSGDDKITVEEIAQKGGSISHEILTSLL